MTLFTIFEWKAELFKVGFQKKEERNLYDKLVLLKKMMEISKSVYFFYDTLKKYVAIFNQILISNIYYQLLIVYNIVQHSIS